MHQLPQLLPLLQRSNLECGEYMAYVLESSTGHRKVGGACATCAYAAHIALSHPALNVDSRARVFSAIFPNPDLPKEEQSGVRVSGSNASVGTGHVTSIDLTGTRTDDKKEYSKSQYSPGQTIRRLFIYLFDPIFIPCFLYYQCLRNQLHAFTVLLTHSHSWQRL